MKWWKRIRLFHRHRTDDRLTQERLELFWEIEKAKTDWMNAQKKLNDVVEKEQIDFAIFALEAAEKRYEMLLKQAKKLRLHALEFGVRRGGRAV